MKNKQKKEKKENKKNKKEMNRIGRIKKRGKRKEAYYKRHKILIPEYMSFLFVSAYYY